MKKPTINTLFVWLWSLLPSNNNTQDNSNSDSRNFTESVVRSNVTLAPIMLTISTISPTHFLSSSDELSNITSAETMFSTWTIPTNDTITSETIATIFTLPPSEIVSASDVPSYIPSDITSATVAAISLSSDIPSRMSSDEPSNTPSSNTSKKPSAKPSMKLSILSSDTPSRIPLNAPSNGPSSNPSKKTSVKPSTMPSDTPSRMPSDAHSNTPSAKPSKKSSAKPSRMQSDTPSRMQSDVPSNTPSVEPSKKPSAKSSPPSNFSTSNMPSDINSSTMATPLKPSNVSESDVPSDTRSATMVGISSQMPSDINIIVTPTIAPLTKSIIPTKSPSKNTTKYDDITKNYDENIITTYCNETYNGIYVDTEGKKSNDLEICYSTSLETLQIKKNPMNGLILSSKQRLSYKYKIISKEDVINDDNDDVQQNQTTIFLPLYVHIEIIQAVNYTSNKYESSICKDISFNNVSCASCYYCGNDLLSADCTNLLYGRKIHCEPTYPLFLPIHTNIFIDNNNNHQYSSSSSIREEEILNNNKQNKNNQRHNRYLRS